MTASSGGRSASLESSGGGGHGGHGHGSERPSSDPVLRRSEAAARRMFTAKWGSDGRAQSLVSGSVTPPGAGAGTPTLRSGSMTPVHGAVDFAHWQWLQEQKQRQQQSEFQMWQQYQQQLAQQQQFHQWQQQQQQQRRQPQPQPQPQSRTSAPGGAPLSSHGAQGDDEGGSGGERSSHSIPIASAVPRGARGAEGGDSLEGGEQDFQSYLARLSSTQQQGPQHHLSAHQADAALTAIAESDLPTGAYSVRALSGGGGSTARGGAAMPSPIATLPLSPIATPVHSDDEDE